jgi:hypothetical protein
MTAQAQAKWAARRESWLGREVRRPTHEAFYSFFPFPFLIPFSFSLLSKFKLLLNF